MKIFQVGFVLLMLVVGFNSCDQSEDEKIGQSIEQLAGGNFESREAAQKELAELGEKAIPALLDSINAKNPERQQRVQALIEYYLKSIAKEGGKAGKEKFDRFFKMKKEVTTGILLGQVSGTDDEKLKEQAAETLLRNANEKETREKLLATYLSDTEKNKVLSTIVSDSRFKGEIKSVLFDSKQKLEARKEAARLLISPSLESDVESLLETLTTKLNGKELDFIGIQIVLNRLKTELDEYILFKKNAKKQSSKERWDRYIVLIKTGLMDFLSHEASEGFEDTIQKIIDTPED